MNMRNIYIEEDLFPREIALCKERNYGLLFYCEENKDSYDSNHAVIYKERTSDLRQVLHDVVQFYRNRGLTPVIFQSILDDGYFEEIKQELTECGFASWSETQKYMVLCEDNVIPQNKNITVQKISVWNHEYGTEIFEKANEPWEIGVTERALQNENTLFFVAFCGKHPAGMIRCHLTEDICRVDYLLVSKEYRNIGVARALVKTFVEYCKDQNITNCYLWPDGKTAEKIYYEAGFRTVETKQAGRAEYILK